jgi:hypothetical protein
MGDCAVSEIGDRLVSKLDHTLSLGAVQWHDLLNVRLATFLPRCLADPSPPVRVAPVIEKERKT